MKLSPLILVLAATAFAAVGWLPAHTIEGATGVIANAPAASSVKAVDLGTPSPTPPCVSWEYKASYPLPIADAATATDGTSVYVFAGRTFQAITDAVNRYDPSNDMWTPLPSMPGGVDFRLFAEYGGNGKIYVMGGSFNGSLMRIYDIATNTWSAGQPIPTPLIYAGHAYSNGTIYVIGGRSSGVNQTSVHAYHIATNTWSGLSPMPQGRFSAASGIINGKIYIAGGSTDGFNSRDSLFIYDIAANTWTTGPTLPTPVKLPGGVVFQNELWVLGGSTADPAIKTTQIYNPVSNSWRLGPQLQEDRESARAATTNSAGAEKMFVVGGVTAFSNLSNSVEGSVPICSPTPTPTPSVTPTPVPTPTPPVPTPSVPIGPIVRDGLVDFGFSLSASQVGTGEVTSITAGPGDKMYIGGAFGSILGVPVPNIARVFQDGVVDQSFSVGTGPNSIVRRIYVQTDGKLLVSGGFTTFNGFQQNYIVRLNHDGSVDTSFTVTSNATQLDICSIQPDGRVLVCGNFTTINGVSRKQVARLESSGSVDLSFDFGTGVPGSGFVRVIKPLADGKMLIGGNFSSINGTVREGIARLNADGSVDMSYTFGTSVSFVMDIQADTEGKTVVTTLNRLFRAMPDGNLDPGFNPDIQFSSTARFGTPLPDGKIMVGGDLTQVRVGTTSVPTIGMARLNNNGTIDLSYSSPLSGSPSVSVGYLNTAGKLTIGGGFLNIGTDTFVGLVRFNNDGSRDLSFIGRLLARSIIFTSLVQSDGKIMVGGSFDTLNSSRRMRVGRVNPDGSVDDTFVPDPSIDGASIEAIVRQPDGKYLVGGSSVPGGNRALWRLNADGTLDSSFLLTTFNTNSFVLAIGLQPDGKILVGGGFSTVNGESRGGFARLNPDGSLDNLILTSASQFRIEAINVQPDGRFIIGGAFNGINGISGIQNIAKLNLDGSVDQQFSLNHGGLFSQVRSFSEIAGSIYVGSRLSITGVNDSRFPVVKMDPDGTVDLAFNAGNLVGDVYSVSPLPYGKLLVGGSFGVFGESGNRRSLARVLANGGVDYTFDAGTILGNNGAVSETIFTVATLPDNKILVTGAFNSIASQTRWCAARLSINHNVTRAGSDFDGDAVTDIALFRPSNSVWYWLKSYGGQSKAATWGLSSDKLVPADYDSDGRTDLAVFRPSEARWYVLESSRSTLVTTYWGVATDIPTPGNFDGDGRADLAIFRPADGTWWINRTTGGVLSFQFGQDGDKPVVADYDGDGQADTAIYRSSVGQWWLNRSTAGVVAFGFGDASDKAVPGDYTGDGKADVAFWRPSTGEWYILRSEDTSYYSAPFGISTDIPAPGDYDGDGKFDTTVFRPSNGNWYLQRTTAGTLIHHFGKAGDQPIPNAFVP